MDRAQAAEWVYTAEAARRRAWKARRAFWVPLVIFGVLCLAAAPLYRFPLASPGGATDRRIGPLSWFAGGFFLRNPNAVSLFWLVSLPVGYALTVLYYRYRGRRRGVTGTVWPYAIAGLAFLAILVLGSVLGRLQPGDLFIRGLTPLLTIAVGLFVLAAAERSVPLAIFSAAFLGLALVVNLYDIENLFSRAGVTVPVPAIGVILPGAVLVLAAVGFWLAGRRSP